MSSLDLQFPYSVSGSTTFIKRDDAKSRLVVPEIESWKLKNVLSELTTAVCTLRKDSDFIKGLIPERKVLVPIMKEPGIITKIEDKDENLEFRVSELAWHLTRKIFRKDGEGSVVFTSKEWMMNDYANRKKFTFKKENTGDSYSDLNHEVQFINKEWVKNSWNEYYICIAHPVNTGFKQMTVEYVDVPNGDLTLLFSSIDALGKDNNVLWVYYNGMFSGNHPDVSPPTSSNIVVTADETNNTVGISNHEIYPQTAKEIATMIIESANKDMPFEWKIDDDIDDTILIEGKWNWLNHYEALRLVAKLIAADLWFEGNVVHIGQKGRIIDLTKDSVISNAIRDKVDLDDYANTITVVGNKNDAGNSIITEDLQSDSDLLYDYEKVITGSNLDSQDMVDDAAVRLLDEYNVQTPNVNINIGYIDWKSFGIVEGDVLRIAGDLNSKVRGFYRVVKMEIDDVNVDMELQFSSDGKFIPRIIDVIGVFDNVFDKIKNLET